MLLKSQCEFNGIKFLENGNVEISFAISDKVNALKSIDDIKKTNKALVLSVEEKRKKKVA